MKQVTLHIPDKKYPFFIELIKSLSFIKKIEEKPVSEKDKALQNLREAVHEMNRIKAGKIKARPLQELLDEL